MKRLVTIDQGRLMVVTDLHGDYKVYSRYRDCFLDLSAKREVDTWVICGDMIHSDGPADTDGSVAILLDLIRLQRELGNSLLVLLGNHELPHLYGITLMKGNTLYTPRFEKALTEAQRAMVIPFLDSLPFYIRTFAGVSIAHAGACRAAATRVAWEFVINYSHTNELAKVDALLNEQDRAMLRRSMEKSNNAPYAEMVAENLGLTDPSHPRYDDLLRGALISMLSSEFQETWEALFTRNEQSEGEAYAQTLQSFLARISEGHVRQDWLVSGHIKVRGSHAIIAKKQLRLASWAHAQPREAGQYLLLDAARPITEMGELLVGLRSVFDS